MAQKARGTWSLIRVREVGVRPAVCPICGWTLLVKLAHNAISVRCVRCHSSAIHMSLVQVIRKLYANLSGLTVYEMSSRGPLFDYLKNRIPKLIFSEYFDGVAPGEYKNGVQCQDVHRLTYPDAAFDLCTSTEVFEHVPDDRKGFGEIRRVLRPGGRFIFTVPITEAAETAERARIVDGRVHHFLTPEYHGDAIRGPGRVLCFRNYGPDILDRLRATGFSNARLEIVDDTRWWRLGRSVVVAEK
jgi:SAM-dependent methyltransferase